MEEKAFETPKFPVVNDDLVHQQETPMSTRTNLRPQIVIPSPQGSPANGNSMAANIISAPTVMQSITGACYSISWSGTSPVGTISIQSSGDYALSANGTVANSGTWTNMTVTYSTNTTPATQTQAIPISGNSGSGTIDIPLTAVPNIRLIYTATSGTGALTAIFNGKVS